MANTEGEKEKKLDISEFVWFNDANENFRKLQEELQLYGTCFLKSISKWQPSNQKYFPLKLSSPGWWCHTIHITR